MKSRIRQSLTNSLGIENVENIAIKVSEIIKKDSLDENKDENIDHIIINNLILVYFFLK